MEQLSLWSDAENTVTPYSTFTGYKYKVVCAGQLQELLCDKLHRPVNLVITNNRSTMLSFRDTGDTINLRLHNIFLESSQTEQEALVLYLKSQDKHAGQILDHFIQSRIVVQIKPPRHLHHKGFYHNLKTIMANLNTSYFHNTCQAKITWSKARYRKAKRTIQLGSYLTDENLIRIHPCLDQKFVPRYYVAWVIFHEMLHEVYGTDRLGSRRVFHTPEFSALEETFENYTECKKWERDNLNRLLHYRPR